MSYLGFDLCEKLITCKSGLRSSWNKFMFRLCPSFNAGYNERFLWDLEAFVNIQFFVFFFSFIIRIRESSVCMLSIKLHLCLAFLFEFLFAIDNEHITMWECVNSWFYDETMKSLKIVRLLKKYDNIKRTNKITSTGDQGKRLYLHQ